MFLKLLTHYFTHRGDAATKPQERGSCRHSPPCAACRVGRLALAERAVRLGIPAKGQPAVCRHLAHLHAMPGCSACAMRVVCMQVVTRSGATGTVPQSRMRDVSESAACEVKKSSVCEGCKLCVWYGMCDCKWPLQGTLMTAVTVVSL